MEGEPLPSLGLVSRSTHACGLLGENGLLLQWCRRWNHAGLNEETRTPELILSVMRAFLKKSF